MEALGLRSQDLYGRQGGLLPTALSKVNRDLTLYDRAYRALLEGYELLDEDWAHLHGRGLSHAEIETQGYRSIRVSAGKASIYPLEKVPGFERQTYAPYNWETTVQGLAIPVFDTVGRIRGIQVRTTGDAKYKWLSGGPGGKSGVPPQVRGQGPYDAVRVTEGPIKANVSWSRTRVSTIGICGSGLWKTALPIIKEWRPLAVYLAFDMDWQTNAGVAESRRNLAEELLGLGYRVFAETWDPRYKGFDDLLLRGYGEGADCPTVTQWQ